MPLNINVNKDDFNLNDYLYCFSQFNSRPNKILLYENYLPNEFIEIVCGAYHEDKDETLLTEIMPGNDGYITNNKVFTKFSETVYISYVHVNQSSDIHLVGEVTIYYKDSKDLTIINKIVEELSLITAELSEPSEICKTNTLTVNSGQLELESIDIEDTNDSEHFELYYHPDTFKSSKKLIKLINKADRGVSILWGERGTGKTTMIKHILSNINRMSIFMPNNMVDSTINNPEFKAFIKRHPNLLIVIDDCEIFFNEAYTKSNMFTSNIIQLVDGFLAETMNLQFLLSFNIEDESDIDHTLIDSNSLVDVIEFKYLDEKTIQELSSSLKLKVKSKGEQRVIDILKRNTNTKPYIIGF